METEEDGKEDSGWKQKKMEKMKWIETEEEGKEDSRWKQKKTEKRIVDGNRRSWKRG